MDRTTGFVFECPPSHSEEDARGSWHEAEYARPKTEEKFKCKEWEPKWDGDERILDAWEKFQFSYNMMKEHDK